MGDVLLKDMINHLLNPDRFPEPTTSVSVIQTHISMVFLTDRFVYKIKKPVNFGFLDFTSLEKRHYYCNKEVELNRRLSEDLYLGVLPVIQQGGQYRIGEGSGKVVDYAVKIRRIPEETLMKNLFEHGKLSEHHLELLARKMAKFHQTAVTSPEIASFGRPEAFRVNTEENFSQVRKYIGQTIGKKVFEDLRVWTDEFYSEKRELFERRVERGKVRDCHGDLHMEHISFDEEKVNVFDCIEFNERFRYSDTIADMAFLLMDLDYRGGSHLSRVLWNKYAAIAQEGEDVFPLLKFYKVYRAFVRGKVISFQLDDPQIQADEKAMALKKARAYFQLAYSYIMAN